MTSSPQGPLYGRLPPSLPLDHQEDLRWGSRVIFPGRTDGRDGQGPSAGYSSGPSRSTAAAGRDALNIVVAREAPDTERRHAHRFGCAHRQYAAEAEPKCQECCSPGGASAPSAARANAGRVHRRAMAPACRPINYSLSEMASQAGRVRPHNQGLSIRLLGPSEVDFVAQLHADALPHGFFVSLGQPYLRAYYRSFLTSPHAWGLVARLDDDPIGFLVGVLDPQSHRLFTIRRHGARLALQGGRALARHPPLALNFFLTRLGRYTKGILRTLRPRCAQPGTGQQSSACDGLGVLAHVAVVDSERGSGVGEVLVDAFVSAARSAGLVRIELLTLADELGATSFYERLGWRRVEELMDGDLRFVKFELALE